MIVCPNRERKERLMRVIFKICILPVILILSMMKLLLDVAERVYCLVAGVAINALIVCVVLALITGQWLALGVFGALFLVLMAVLFGAGTITVMIDNLRERLMEV